MALRERGLRVPEDISIVTFNNTVLSEYSDPPLTSIELFMRENVRAAAFCMQLLWQGNVRGKRIVVPCELVSRGSVAPAPLIVRHLNYNPNELGIRRSVTISNTLRRSSQGRVVQQVDDTHFCSLFFKFFADTFPNALRTASVTGQEKQEHKAQSRYRKGQISANSPADVLHGELYLLLVYFPAIRVTSQHFVLQDKTHLVFINEALPCWPTHRR